MVIEETTSAFLIKFQGLEKLWALKSQLEIPKNSIINISWHPNWILEKGTLWWRLGGGYLPGFVMAGRYYGYHRWLFAYVRKPYGLASIRAKNVLLFETTGHYSMVAITCEDQAQALSLPKFKNTSRPNQP